MSEGLLAAGTLYVDALVAGQYQGEQQWPGLAKFAYKPNSTLVESKTKDKGKYGQLSVSVAVPEPGDFSVVITEVTGQALAMALQGSVETYSQGSGSLTDADYTSVKKGTYVDLGFHNFASAGFTVKNADGTVTYVKGTDYTINYQTGHLYIVPAGAIADASTIQVSGSYNAVSGELVRAGTKAQVRGRLRLDGENLVDGRALFADVWDALLTADSEVDFLSDKPVELSMKGRLMTPVDKTEPLLIKYKLDMS